MHPTRSHSSKLLQEDYRFLQICVAVCLLCYKLGPSILVGVVILFVLLVLSSRLSITSRRYQACRLSLKDKRLKLMSEILSGIKMIKLNAWENAFADRVEEIRKEEVHCLKRAAILDTITVCCWACLPILITTGTFLAHAWLNEAHSLSPTTAFVSISLFNILRYPMNTLPAHVSELLQGYLSFYRLVEFLSSEELNPTNVLNGNKTGSAIVVKGATFTWDRNLKPALKRVSVRVGERELVGVVGPVGAGKTSLLSAFLGEMYKLKGSVSLKGSVAYVAQDPWIQSKTLQKCILFGQPLNEKRYRRVIRACALRPDIASFAHGDETAIGEKGANLSGGQKARVALARAVYQDSAVYLLDDPLSALDSRVAKQVFRNVISNTGLLKGKTRVLVTNGLQWLPYCDAIILIEQGQITQTGSYQELLKSGGPFAQFLDSCSSQDAKGRNQGKALSVHTKANTNQKGVTLPQTPVAQDKDGTIAAQETSCTDNESIPPVKTQVQPGKTKDDRATKVTTKGKLSILKSLLLAFGVRQAVCAVLCLITYNAAGVAASFCLSRWSGDTSLKNAVRSDTSTQSMSRAALYALTYSSLGFVQAIFTVLFVAAIYINMASASERLHSSMLINIMRQPMSFFDTTPSGEILQRFSRNVSLIDVSLGRVTRMFIQHLFNIVSVVTVITYNTPVFLFGAVPIMVLFCLLKAFHNPCSKQLRNFETTTRSPVLSHVSESLTGQVTVRAARVTGTFQAELERLEDVHSSYMYLHMCSTKWLKARLDVLSHLIVVFTALLLVVNRDVSSSAAGLSIVNALQMTTALSTVVFSSSQLETSLMSVKRVLEYIRLPREPDWVVKSNRPPLHWPNKGEVTFDCFSTRYNPDLDLALNSITCTLHSGEKVGVVGRTGAGKSSLAMSLFRLTEAAEGVITIDGLNIANIGLHDLRSRITVLPQDPVLFSGSVKSNLDPIGQYSDSEIWSALDKVHLSGAVLRLSGGLEHTADEGGLNFSQGQRQLLCLARALLRHTRVLVLDEATAAVDVETDFLIQKTLRQAFRTCTVVTIAHRLNTVMDYDRIIVLEAGRIVEMDSPDALLKNRNSVFFKMALQAHVV